MILRYGSGVMLNADNNSDEINDCVNGVKSSPVGSPSSHWKTRSSSSSAPPVILTSSAIKFGEGIWWVKNNCCEIFVRFLYC
ncbi:hypothetical protein Hanom_Chr11g01015811 [Helianthus anomalus]